MLVSDRARRSARTAITNVLSVVIVVLVLVPVILEALKPLQEQMPGNWYPWLVGVAATIIAVATAVQRILTSDVVERLLQAKAPSLAAASPAMVPAADVVASVNPDGHLVTGPASTLPTGDLIQLGRPVRDLIDPTV